MTQTFLPKKIDFPVSCCYSGSTSEKGELVVPTIGFILCAYLVYALLRGMVRRGGRLYRRRHPWPQRRLTLAGGAGVGAGFLIFLAIAVIPAPSGNFQYAGMITPGWEEEMPPSSRKPVRQEFPPIKVSGNPGRPIYAYLHPETPAPQLTQENVSLAPRPTQRSRQIKPAFPGKAPRAMARLPKKEQPKDRDKEKTLHKNRVPKKKPVSPVSPTAGGPPPKSG
jgi:hypothetical protein